MRRLVWTTVAVALLSACVFADPSLENRACPCVEGWVCRDDACVPASAASDGPADGGPAAPDNHCDKPVQFDPDNCGVCGHACAGAACKDGLCAKTRITEQAFPTAIAVTSKWVTFTVEDPSTYPGGTVAFCPRTGCTGTLGAQAHEILCPQPMSIAVTEDDAFWGKADGRLSRGPHEMLPDGASKHGLQNVATDVAKVSELALDGTRVFFAETSASGSIRACDGLDLRTCADGGSAVVIDARPRPRALTFERTSRRLFWIDDAANGAIWSCAADGPCDAPVLVAAGQPHAHALAADARAVFWTNAEEGTVMQAAATPGARAEVLAHDLATPWGIAVDSDYVYVTTLGTGAADAATADGEILRVPRDGGTPLVLAKNLARPWSVVVDGSLVFWTNRGSQPTDGTIESVAK